MVRFVFTGLHRDAGLELPSCRDIGGEEPNTHGFCPVDFYVPWNVATVILAGQAGMFGFVAGSIWGDDSSWKIQDLDLTDVSNGRLVRTERFGYVEMQKGVRLSECVALDRYEPPRYPIVDLQIKPIHAFNLATAKAAFPDA